MKDITNQSTRSSSPGQQARDGQAASPPPSRDDGRERIAPCPPLVIRGANKKGEAYDVSVGIDWFRVTSPIKQHAAVLAELTARFGPPQPGRGIHFYEASWRFANKAILAYDVDGDKGHCIDLPGEALATMEPDEAVAFCRSLLWGRRCTRIDARIDWQADEGVGLIDACISSCRAGELCRARKFKPQEECTNSLIRTAYGVCFGKRGNDGSGRYVRVYDKGLETGERPEGTWERWEAELTGDVAADAAVRILGETGRPDGERPTASDRPSGEPTSWYHAAMSIALGCVEFREQNGSTALERRPLAAWWAALLENVRPVVIVAKRMPTSLERWTGWMRRCGMPTLVGMAAMTDEPVYQVMERLGLLNVLPSRDAATKPPVWQYAEYSLRPQSYEV